MSSAPGSYLAAQASERGRPQIGNIAQLIGLNLHQAMSRRPISINILARTGSKI